MFDQFKAMGAVADLLKNQDKIRDAADRVKRELEATEVTGQAAGGIARVTMTGAMRTVATDIAPSLAAGLASDDDEQRRIANQVITEAVNDAMARAQQAARTAIEREAAALGIPGLAARITRMLPGLEPPRLP